MTKFLRDHFLLNAIEREIEYTNRAVNNGNDDKIPYLQAGRQLLKELTEAAESERTHEPPRLTTYGEIATLTGKGNP